MKQLVITLLTVMFSVAVSAQDVKVEFITPRIVHIVKGQPTKTLVITAKPEDVAVSKSGNTWKSAELTVKQDAQGNLTFLTAKGKVLLKEKNCDVKEVRQTFTLDKDEAVYGLGTFQDGKMKMNCSICRSGTLSTSSEQLSGNTSGTTTTIESN